MTGSIRRPVITRREALLAGGAAAGAFMLRVGPASAATVMELGAKKIRSLSDGNLVQPVSFVFGDLPKEQVEPLLAANGLDTETLEPECNLTLVEEGERTILFDAGSGLNFMPTAGTLPDALEEAGIGADAITDVVFTHAHPDHLWGIVDEFDEISFPEANLHFPSVEWHYWAADDVLSKLPESRHGFAIGAKNRMTVIEERIQLFEAGAEVLPGIEAVATYGHTPGHTSFAIHGGSESLMVVGDALTNAAVSFQKPDWPMANDQDSDLAVATRQSLLDRLVSDNMPIIGYHLPDGGAGRVEKDGTAYRFVGLG